MEEGEAQHMGVASARLRVWSTLIGERRLTRQAEGVPRDGHSPRNIAVRPGSDAGWHVAGGFGHTARLSQVLRYFA